VPLLSLIDFDDFLRVDGQTGVRVHHDAKESRVSINESRKVSLLDVVQHGRLVEAREAGHVLGLVELRGVHLLDVVSGHAFSLSGLDDFHLDLVSPVGLDGGGHEAVHLVGNPDELLRGPLGLDGRVAHGVAVDDEVLEIGVVAVDAQVGHGVAFNECVHRRAALRDSNCFVFVTAQVLEAPSGKEDLL